MLLRQLETLHPSLPNGGHFSRGAADLVHRALWPLPQRRVADVAPQAKGLKHATARVRATVAEGWQ
jgi:hypothetical protein